MVKGIRLQKPLPKALLVSCAGTPMAKAASTTMKMPTTANTQESGNHFSAQLAQRMAKRAARVSSMLT